MPCNSRRAGKIHERLVDRDRSTCGSCRASAREPAGLRLRISPVGADDSGVRAEPLRPEHRHRRAHAEGAGDIAGGRDHAALAAADDQRLSGEGRVVTLLDRGIEGVAIDMADGQRIEFRMAGECAARSRPGSAPPRRCRGGSRGRKRPSRRVPFPDPAEQGAGTLDLGRVDPGVLREGDQQRLVAGKMVEHAVRKLRSRAGCGSGRGRCRWRRGTGRGARFRRQKRQRCDGKRLGRLALHPVFAAAGLCRSSWLPILDAH